MNSELRLVHAEIFRLMDSYDNYVIDMPGLCEGLDALKNQSIVLDSWMSNIKDIAEKLHGRMLCDWFRYYKDEDAIRQLCEEE